MGYKHLDGYEWKFKEVTGPSNYDPTKGIEVTFGVERIDKVVSILSEGGYVPSNINISGNKVVFHVYVSGGSEVTSGTDLSAVKFQLMVLAKP